MMRYMKKILSAVLLAAMLLSVCCASAAAYTPVESYQPDNVRIHLFDYTVTGTVSGDNTAPTGGIADLVNRGINAGHAFLFTNYHDRTYGWWNGISTGRLVKPYLNQAGYPVLDLNASAESHGMGAQDGTFKTLSTVQKESKLTGRPAVESLEYLFNPNNSSNTHYNASKLLLQNSAENQYYFDSGTHFAEFDTDSKQFTIYSEESGDASEFFPFDKANNFQVATSNHYLGMVMEVDFYLTQNGKIQTASGEKDIVFSFSGDDDVFVFVDNLLVGSVGGIHGPRTIDINFRTGVVTEGRDKEGDNSQSTTHTTSIGDYYNSAKTELQKTIANGGLGMREPEAVDHLPILRTLDGKQTFRANEKHTLRMFYLERGHHSSVLKVAFNLLSPYMPEQDYTLKNTVTGGNDALLALPFTYALTFDMSGVIKDVSTAKYVVKNAGGTVLESGTVTFAGSAGSKTIAAATKTEGGASSYISRGKAELKNGESITFTLPDQTKVTSVQSLPAKPDALSVNPFELDSLAVVPSSGTTNKDDAKIVANVVNIAGAGSATYNNKILTSDVTIAKTVTHADGVEPTTGSFAFSVTGLDDFEKVKDQNYSGFTLGNTGSKTLTVIRGAQFSVSETDDPNDGFVYVSGNAENMTADEETKSVTVTNFYPSPVTAALAAKKSITGRNFQTGDAFIFTAVSGDFAGGDERANLTKTINPESGSSADVLFDAISFDFSDLGGAESKVFTYTISENDSTVPGVSKDTTTYTAKVTLSKTGEGEHTVLTKDVAYYKADGTTPLDEGMTVPTFVNVYKSTGTLTIPATKTITGRSFKTDDSFTFKVTGSEGAPGFSDVNENGEVTISQLSGAEATINFGSLSFNQTHVGKEYTYTFEEVQPDTGIPGVSYSTQKHTIVVTLTDDQEGKITAKAQPESISWENTYTASGSLSVKGTKKIEGRAFQSGDSFTFKVEPQTTGAPMFSGVNAEGKITISPTSGSSADIAFGSVSFTQEHVGQSYTYKITEEAGSDTNLTYDTTPKRVTITLSDDGQGSITATANPEVPEWTNRYASSGSVSVTGRKNMTGRAFQSGDSFTFKVEPQTTGAPMFSGVNENGEVTIEPTSGRSEYIAFGSVSFTQEHVGQSYTYKITEESGSDTNLTYDTTPKRVTITLSDDGQGSITATANPEVPEWTNTYSSAGSVTLTGKKIMDGRAFKADDSFEFNVAYGSEEVPESETPKLMKDGSAVASVQINPTSGTEAAIEFGTIAFNQDHVGKTFTYKFTEVTPQTGALPSVAYSTVEHTVTVKVKDDGRGTMTLDVTEPEGGLVWTNEYRTSAEQSLKGIKKITGREFKAGDSFTFNVTYGSEEVPESETPKLMKDGSAVESVAITPTSGTQAEIDFGTVAFNQDHADKTFTYTFTEADGTRPGLAYDGTSYTVTIKISDDGKGTLTAHVTGGDALEWTNSFAQQSGTYAFSVSKTLTGRKIGEGEFSFTMEPLGSADYEKEKTEYAYSTDQNQPVPDTLKAAANAAGAVDFGVVEFVPELFDREVTGPEKGKVYFYKITEDVPDEATQDGTNAPVYKGVTYDQTEHILGVHVYTVEETVNGVKTVAVKTEVAGCSVQGCTGSAVFANTYQAVQTTTEAQMTKLVNGAEPAAEYDGAFTFTLTAKDGVPMPVSGEAGSTSMTVANSASAIVFGQIVYTEAGEYLYTVKENPLASHISGMQIDPTVYTMKVTVTDPGDGQLIQTTQFCADPEAENPVWTDTLTFDNDYVQPKLEDLTGIKKIVNRGETTDRGDHIEYQIVITNHSRDTLRNLVIMDEVPEYTEFVSCSADGTYDRESNRVTFRKESLGAGESATFELTVKALHGNVSVTNVAVFGTPDIPETMRGDIPACLTNEVELYISVKLAGVPNTGDHTHMGWWLLMLSASVLGLCAVKKRRDA